MNNSTRFRVNAPNVVHEVIDGEAVIVNMGNGAYYSTDKSGAYIWELVTSGATTREILDSVCRRYEGDRGEIGAAIECWVSQLCGEGLLVPGDERNSATPAAPEESGQAAGTRPAFEAPVLQKYTDVEDLLFLDPIHEVGDGSWPDKSRE